MQIEPLRRPIHSNHHGYQRRISYVSQCRTESNVKTQREQRMTHGAVAIMFCSLLLAQNLKPKYGSVTIFTVPETWSKYVGPGKFCESSKLSVRIDNGNTVRWPRKQRVEVRDLVLDQSHLVTARCSGKPLQATRFRFSDFKSTHVCVTYDVYGGIYIFDDTTRGWGCKQESE